MEDWGAIGEPAVAVDEKAAIAEEVERLKLQLQHELKQMRLAALVPNIKEMEERGRRITEMSRNDLVPKDVMRICMAEMNELELIGYQKGTDYLLRRAMTFGLERKVAEKAQAIQIARRLFDKAISRGCSDEFKKATEMAFETAQLTSTIKGEAPNRAKPDDPPSAAQGTAAKSSAKDEQRGAKRYGDPVLTVTIGNDSFQTVNWSISGLLLADCCRMDIGPGLETTAAVTFSMMKQPLMIPTRIIRVDPDRRRTSLTYTEKAPPEIYAFFKKLIMSKSPGGAAAS